MLAHMVMIQIRHVPEDVHRRLKAQAAAEGLSLSDYLRREVERIAGRLSWREVAERARQRGQVTASAHTEDIVRALRDERG